MVGRAKNKKNVYESDIVLGERYRDSITQVEGTAISIHFYVHACERITLRTVSPKTGEILEYGFDAAELVHIDSDTKITTDRPGGPERATGARSAPPSR